MGELVESFFIRDDYPLKLTADWSYNIFTFMCDINIVGCGGEGRGEVVAM